jgi:thiol-disulfide isomerase/thioredoxin
MLEDKPKSRTPLFLTLITAGVFLVGAALIPLLVQGQEIALRTSGVIRQPVVFDQVLPHLALSDLQGNPVILGETRGKVVLINNWATWCPSCQAELPDLQAYYQAHVNQGFVLIGIESGESADTVSNYVRQLGITFPIWLDPHGAALDSFKNWDLPSFYVIDRLGVIRMSWTGSINQATLEKYITPLLEK